MEEQRKTKTLGEKKSIHFHGKKSDQVFWKAKNKRGGNVSFVESIGTTYAYSFAAKVEEISETDIDE